MYGDPSWIVAQIIKGGSENTMMPSPLFSAYIDSIKMAPDRRQDTQYVGKISTVEREYNTPTVSGYGPGPGVRQDIDRYMPVPYDLYLKLDVWTTNINTKLQIFEQIGMIFNPSVQLQQNSNLLDWTSIFEVWLEDYVFTNRSIPQGGDIDRDIMSFRFKVPIWINPPAKLKRSGVIAEIVTSVFDVTDINETKIQEEYDPFRTCVGGIPIQIVTTVGDYRISVAKTNLGDEITLLTEYGVADPNLSWQELIQKYGQITPNITSMRLKLDPNLDVSDSDIIGGIAQDPNRQNVLIFTPDIDTLPPNTISPITAIIDPVEVTPGNGLPPAQAGQRYLLTSSSSAGEEPAFPPGVITSPWGDNIVAYPNDIIEFDGTNWVVVFDSRNSTGKNYVVNNSNSSQYMFDGVDWTYTYYGVYSPGYWRIDNIIQAPNGTTISNYE